LSSQAMPAGTLYIISAPSGAGKTSLVNALVARLDQLVISISYTTRKPRSQERQNVQYHFLTEPEFKQMIGDDVFLEYALVFGNYYGTHKATVEQQLLAGVDVILEIDWQGARQVRARFPHTKSIFIFPPSMQILRERLQNRRQDTLATIETRLAEAQLEMQHYHEYDYLIINEEFETALQQLAMIVTANRLHTKTQAPILQQKLAELLG